MARPEVKQKVLAGIKAKRSSAEYIAKQEAKQEAKRLAKLEQTKAAEARKAARLASQGTKACKPKQWSVQTKEKHKEATRAAMARPEVKAKMSQASKALWQDEEHRAKQSAVRKANAAALWEKDSHRAKLAATFKAKRAKKLQLYLPIAMQNKEGTGVLITSIDDADAFCTTTGNRFGWLVGLAAGYSRHCKGWSLMHNER